MINWIVFWIGFFLLTFLTYNDLKRMEIQNSYTLIFVIISLITLMIFGQKNKIFEVLGIIVLIFLILLILWTKKSIGGADVKIIPFVMPFILINSPNIFVGFWFFLIIFGIVGTIYGLIFKWTNKKNKKEVPFLPSITLTYIFYYIVLYFWTIK